MCSCRGAPTSGTRRPNLSPPGRALTTSSMSPNMLALMSALAKALALPVHARWVVQQFQSRPRAAGGAAASAIPAFSASKRQWGQRRGCATGAGAPAGGGSGGSGGFLSHEEILASPEAQELIRRSAVSMEKKQMWNAM